MLPKEFACQELACRAGWRVSVHELSRDAAAELCRVQTAGVTDRKRAEEELREAGRRKDELLAMLAHELRTPLAPILSAAHLVRLIAVTAYGREGDLRRALQAGFDGHLTKPVDPERLLGQLGPRRV